MHYGNISLRSGACIYEGSYGNRAYREAVITFSQDFIIMRRDNVGDDIIGLPYDFTFS